MCNLLEYQELSNVGLSMAPGVETLKCFQLSMASRGGGTLRGVGRRKMRIRRQERGRTKVTRLSKSKHITFKVREVTCRSEKGVNLLFEGKSGGSQVCNRKSRGGLAFSNAANDTRPLQCAASVSALEEPVPEITTT